MKYCYLFAGQQSSLRGANLFLRLKAFLSILKLTVFFIIIILIQVNAKGRDQIPSPFPSISITGTVTDSATGSPLMGVTIQVKGRSMGTTTDANGNFSLEVADDAVLVVSYLGYNKKEVAVNGKTTFNIALAAAAMGLSQVVVVGYGTQRKVDVTGAISSVKGTVLKRSPAANLSNSLAGRIPGVVLNNRSGEPGNDASNILIRGKGTLNDNSPLIVIDGVADRGSFDRLNPNDIASITVLKDASAAIYGARAANGVILVTTKRGKTGKPTITYNGDFGLTQPTRLPHLVNAWQYATYINEVNDRKGIPHQFSSEDIQKYKTGKDPLNYPNTDWYHAIIKNFSPQTRHSLSLSGGGQKIEYYLSGQYSYQDGIFRNSATYYHQYNLRSNIDAHITKSLEVSLDISGRIEDRHYSNYSSNSGGYTIFGVALGIYPTLPAYYPNGLPGPGKELALNPVLMATGKTGYDKEKDYFLRNKLSFKLNLSEITKGLFIKGSAAYDFHFNNDKRFKNNWDAYQYNKNTKQYVNIKAVEGLKTLNESFRNFHHKTYDLTIGYDNSFGSHNISAFIAYEQSENYNEGISAYRTGFPTDLIDQMDFGSNTGKDNGGNASHSARQDIFGRITYNFNEKYLAEFILRHDGSFNFPNGKRWGTFPAVSVGWRISEESFFRKNISFVNQLKLKASWGRLGNDRVPRYQYVQLYNLDGGYYFGASDNLVPGLSPGVVPNPGITWEVADTKNVGLESSLWNGLLSLDANYFFSTRSNILIPRNASIPTSTGLADDLPDENIGVVKNHGFEIDANHRRKINKDFSYYLGFNYTYTKNEVVFMDEAAGIPDWQRIEGHPMDSWLVYKTKGIFNTQKEIDQSVHLAGTKPGDLRYIDVNDDGEISSNDMVRIYESPTPMSIYGITMGFNYKGIGLNILWQGQGKAMQLIQPEQGDATTPPLWMFEDRWTPDHPNRNFPASFDRNDAVNNRSSDFWLKNASFIRLKTIELSYTFPEKIIAHLNLKNLRVYLNGFNVFTFSEIKYYDPEINVERGNYYPQTRIFNVGINVSL